MRVLGPENMVLCWDLMYCSSDVLRQQYLQMSQMAMAHMRMIAPTAPMMMYIRVRLMPVFTMVSVLEEELP